MARGRGPSYRQRWPLNQSIEKAGLSDIAGEAESTA